METVLSVIAHYYFPILVVVTAYFFVLAAVNILYMRHFTAPPDPVEGPLISVLIPVRNEEDHIEACLRSLCGQTYRNYEILVINDNSTDGTGAILERMAAGDSRIRVFTGAALPDDWYGKPFALQQLSTYARGELLLLTDADTEHAPTSLSWAAANMERNKVDFISGYVGQKLLTIGEYLTVPLMFFLTGFVIPLFLNRFTKFGFLSCAVGQYIVIKNDVFKRIGGFNSFRKKTSEDIFMAKYVKQQGFSTMFLDIGKHVSCRMYNGYWAAVEGIGKNIFDFLGKNSIILFLAMLAVFFFLVFPVFLLIYSLITGGSYCIPLITAVGLLTCTWVNLFLSRRIRWYYALLWPLMFLNLLYIAFWSWMRTISGRGFLWKGRVVT